MTMIQNMMNMMMVMVILMIKTVTHIMSMAMQIFKFTSMNFIRWNEASGILVWSYTSIHMDMDDKKLLMICEQILHWHVEKYGEEKLIVDCHRNETRLIEFAGCLSHLIIYWLVFCFYILSVFLQMSFGHLLSMKWSPLMPIMFPRPSNSGYHDENITHGETEWLIQHLAHLYISNNPSSLEGKVDFNTVNTNRFRL